MKALRHYIFSHKPPNILLHFPSFITILHFANHIIQQRSWRIRRVLNNVLSELSNGSHILDAGCGDGQFLLWAGKKFPNITINGIDIKKGNLDIINSYIKNNNIDNILLQHGNILDINPNKKCALIYCISTLYMLTDDKVLLQSWYNNTPKNCKIILYHPINSKIELSCYAKLRNNAITYEKENAIDKIYTYSELDNLFKKTGWSIEFEEFGMGYIGRIGHELYSYLLLKVANTSNSLLLIFWFISILIVAPISIILQMLDYLLNRYKTDNSVLFILKKLGSK